MRRKSNSYRWPSASMVRFVGAVVLTCLVAGLGACGRSESPSLDLLPATSSGQIEVPIVAGANERLEVVWRWSWETTSERRMKRIRAARAAVEVWFQPADGRATKLGETELDPAVKESGLKVDLQPVAGQAGLLRCAVKRVKPGWIRWQSARVVPSPDAEGGAGQIRTQRRDIPSASMYPNVVILLVDTLRADALGFAGGNAPTPYFDRLAGEGASFDSAYSTSSWTRTSVASLFSGLYPTSHTVTDKDSVLPEEALTLAERFRLLGYETASVFANRHIDAINGFDQGFRHYRPVTSASRQKKSEKFGADAALQGHAAAEEVYQETLRLLRDGRDRSKPLLLYVHTVDPHSPYDPPVWLLDRERPDLVATPELQRRFNSDGTTPSELTDLKTLYDASVAYADHALGAFLPSLATEIDLENTIVVVTADHGEAFGEHGRLGHGLSLFEEEIKIPLMVWAPGRVPQGLRDSRPASLVDVGATVLALAGFPQAPEGLARDLSLAWSPGESEGDPVAVGAQLHLRSLPLSSLRLGDIKLLIDDEAKSTWMFDLTADPQERQDLAGRDQEQLSTLSAAFGNFEQALQEGEIEPSEDPAPVPSQEVIENLRALGYIQ